MNALPHAMPRPPAGRRPPAQPSRPNGLARTVCLLALALGAAAPAIANAAQPGVLAIVRPGEAGAPGRHAHAETLGGPHPTLRMASVRASSFREGHEPYRALDGRAGSDWRFSGPPPAPMARGQWLEVELNEPTVVVQLEVQWLCPKACRYTVYRKLRDDFREPLLAGTSEPGADWQTLRLPAPTTARTLRLEIEPDAAAGEQGVRELRVGGVPYPAGYPLAADRWMQPEAVRRILYVEFERLPFVTTFDMGLPSADGGQALRLLPRDDAFEGGHYDWTLHTRPGRDNWVTVQQWVSLARPGPEPEYGPGAGNDLVLEALDGNKRQRGRSFMPAWVTEQRRFEPEWWGGNKPSAGHWVWVHYRLPAEWVGQRTQVALRLQAVGNLRRDRAMRRPAWPIYRIVHALHPVVLDDAGR